MAKVIHLSITPLAGAPIRLVRTLQKIGVDARLINLNPEAYGTRVFDEDIDFRSHTEEAHQLIMEADLIHLHHWIDLENNPFGINLKDKLVIRQFHSRPTFIANYVSLPVDTIINDPLPQLVVGQFQERFYPNARIVPNILNLDMIENSIINNKDIVKPSNYFEAVFLPTFESSAFSDRWDTKGKPETLKIFSKFEAPSGITLSFNYHSDLPHIVALDVKAKSDIIFDEMITGSYHLSGLEGLALGKPTFGYLDNRTIAVLSSITGSESVPWINTHLAYAPEAITTLLQNVPLLKQVGLYSREWIKKFWKAENLVRHYISAYSDVLNGKKKLRTHPVSPYTSIELQDLNWRRYMSDLEKRLSNGP